MKATIAPMKNTKAPITNIEDHERQQSRKEAKKTAKLLKRQRIASKQHKLIAELV